jgi:hypothetical protein
VILIAFVWKNKDQISFKTIVKHIGSKLIRLPFFYRIIVFLFVVIFLIPGFFLALYLPPANVDGFYCYFVRVENWILNNNIYHYPTLSGLNLYYNHFAQFFLLNFRLLGGDYFGYAIPAFAGFLISITSATLIIKKICNGNNVMQLAAIVICACIPLGILQTSSTGYDYLATGFTLMTIYYILSFIYCVEKQQKTTILLIALSFAVSCYAKYTTVFFILPFLIWLMFFIILRSKKYLIPAALSFIVSFGVLHAELFINNYICFGQLITPKETRERFTNYQPGFSGTMSNLSKNLALNTPFLPLPPIEKGVNNALQGFHHLIGEDIDSRQLNFNRGFNPISFSLNEFSSGAYTTFYLSVFCFFLLFLLPLNFFGQQKIFLMTVCCIGGFILYSAVMKWHPFNSRYQLSGFLLVSLLCAQILSRLKNKNILKFILLLQLLYAIPFVLFKQDSCLVNFMPLRKITGALPASLSGSSEDIYRSENINLKNRLFFYLQNRNSDIREPLRFKKGLTPDEKQIVLNLLDSMNYFNYEKSVLLKKRESIMHTYALREEMAVAKKVIDSLGRYTGAIGLAATNEFSILYFLKKRGFNKFRNIACKEEFRNTPFNNLPYSYSCIITDQLSVIEKTDGTIIDRIIRFPNSNIVIIFLKLPSRTRYSVK